MFSKHILSMLLPVCVVALAASAQDYADGSIKTIELKNCKWERCLENGAVTKVCKYFDGDVMCIGYGFESQWINHVAFLTDLKLDMTKIESVSFDMQFTGSPVNLFVFMYDSAGNRIAYGPYKGAPGQWSPVDVTSKSKIGDGGANIDLKKIVRFGFMINSAADKQSGMLQIKNLAINYDRKHLAVSRTEISPNGDGIFDTSDIKCFVGEIQKPVRLMLCNLSGKNLCKIKTIDEKSPDYVAVEWPSDGKLEKISSGEYKIVLQTGKDFSQILAETPLKINVRQPWPQISYQNDSFLPIALYFEGNPTFADYPSTSPGAEKYYNRCFADMSRMGINTVFIANTPETLWDTLLKSAQKYNLKIILDVPSVRRIINSPDMPGENDIDAEVSRVAGILKNYPALYRYGIYDEPPMHLLERWSVVKRAFFRYDPAHPTNSIFCSIDSFTLANSRYGLSAEYVYDIYPVREDTPLGYNTSEFIKTLRDYEHASKGNRWAVLQAFAKPKYWRCPTDAELRSMTYASLANGVRGICFFIYQSSKSDEKLKGITDFKGKPQNNYATVAKLVSELHTALPLLAKMQTRKDIDIPGSHIKAALFSGNGEALVLVNTDTAKEAACEMPVAGQWTDAFSGKSYDGGKIGLPAGGGKILIRK